MGKHIILAVDESQVSRATVKWAMESIIKPGDSVEVLSVLEPAIRPDFIAAGESAYPVGEELSGKCQPNPLQLERTTNFLKECKNDLKAKGVDDVHLTTLVSCVGGSTDTGRHICDYTKSRGAVDMLVIGSRGMGSAKRAMLGMFGLGSVSDYVVKNACASGIVVHKHAA